MPLIGRVNAGLNASISLFEQRFAGRVSYVDCGEPFALNLSVRLALMPDAVHPNQRGHHIYATCLIHALESVGVAKKPR